jgi:hypothetical protein
MQKLHIIIILISIENNSQLQLKVDVLIMFLTGGGVKKSIKSILN